MCKHEDFKHQNETHVLTESQCYHSKIGLIVLNLVRILAVKICTYCTLYIIDFKTPAGIPLQWSMWEKTKVSIIFVTTGKEYRECYQAIFLRWKKDVLTGYCTSASLASNKTPSFVILKPINPRFKLKETALWALLQWRHTPERKKKSHPFMEPFIIFSWKFNMKEKYDIRYMQYKRLLNYHQV